MPVKGWQCLQRKYISEEGLKKSSRKWIQGLLRKLCNLNHAQWVHRCNVNATITKPQEREHIKLMHDLITAEFSSGEEGLLPGDRHLLNCNILRMLQRPLSYKKSWLVRIHAARQRALRIKAKQDDLKLQSQEKSRLYQWLKIHKSDKWVSRPKRTHSNRSVEHGTIEDEEEQAGDGEYLHAPSEEDLHKSDNRGTSTKSAEQVTMVETEEQANDSRYLHAVSEEMLPPPTKRQKQLQADQDPYEASMILHSKHNNSSKHIQLYRAHQQGD
jgi:hypothetical protein